MKKKDFGHGSAPEYTWFYSAESTNKACGPSLMENLRKMDVKVSKVVDKWDRAFLLDSKVSKMANLQIDNTMFNRERESVSVGSRETSAGRRGENWE